MTEDNMMAVPGSSTYCLDASWHSSATSAVNARHTSLAGSLDMWNSNFEHVLKDGFHQASWKTQA